jgi:putative flippase GtrA
MKLKLFVTDMFKYGLVAAVALTVDFGTLLTLNAFGVNYLVAATIAFVLGLLVNFFLSHERIFHKPIIQNKTLSFTAFFTIGVVGLAFNDAIIWFLVSQFALVLPLAKLIAVAGVFFWDFTARRELLYKGHKEK